MMFCYVGKNSQHFVQCLLQQLYYYIFRQEPWDQLVPWHQALLIIPHSIKVQHIIKGLFFDQWYPVNRILPLIQMVPYSAQINPVITSNILATSLVLVAGLQTSLGDIQIQDFTDNNFVSLLFSPHFNWKFTQISNQMTAMIFIFHVIIILLWILFYLL